MSAEIPHLSPNKKGFDTMMKADEAKKITNEAIEKQREEEKKIMENFLTKAEKEIKEKAQKGQTTCFINVPEAFEYNEDKILDALRRHGYGAQRDCFETIRVTW